MAKFKMPQKTKSNSLSAIKFKLLLSVSILFTVNSSKAESDDDSNTLLRIQIPALGRSATFGDLFDESTGRFLNVNVFKNSAIPNATLATTSKLEPQPGDNPTIHTAITNTFSDKFRLFNVDLPTAANILAGLVQVGGSASFLKDSRKYEDILGVLLYESRTFNQHLQLRNEALKTALNNYMLQHRTATHLLTGITWGANVALGFKNQPPHNIDRRSRSGASDDLEYRSKEDIMSGLASDLKQLESINSVNSNETLNFSISIKSDIFLPIIPSGKSLGSQKEVREYLSQVPLAIQNINGGKGVPTGYILTPMTSVRESLNITAASSTLSTSSSQENDWILKDFVSSFDEISLVEKRVVQVQQQLESQSNCIHPQTRVKMNSLRNKFGAFRSNFTVSFRRSLIKLREISNSNSNSNPNSRSENLISLLDDFNDSEFTAAKIDEKLSEFNSALAKVKLVSTLRKSYPAVEYFGWENQNSLESREFENINKIIYMLFYKSEFISKNRSLWKSNLNIFLKVLNQPFNKLFIIDCDFNYSDCDSVNGTVIKQIRNGETGIEDVREILRKSGALESRKMKAIGRFAQLGDLYDARTDRFLSSSALLPGYPPSLVTTTEHRNEAVSIVPSENYQDKFNALNVDPELQFSILAQLIPLSRSGRYFAPENNINSPDMRSLVHKLHLQDKELSMSHSEFAEILDAARINQGSATHFVAKIEYGYNSIFSFRAKGILKNNNSTQDANSQALEFLRTLLDQFKLAGNSSTELKFTGEYKVYSDIQPEGTKRIAFQNTEMLIQFLNKTFWPHINLKNDGKGQPISYILYPVQNLRTEFGLLGPNRKFQNLASADKRTNPLIFSTIIDEAILAKSQITHIYAQLRKYSDCATDKDFATMKTVANNFSNNSLGTFTQNLRDAVTNFRNGSSDDNDNDDLIKSLHSLVQDLKSKDYFRDGSLRYKELEEMKQFEKKLKLYKKIQNNKSIKYFGRENTDISFAQIFEESEEDSENDQTQVYLLYFKYLWTQERGTSDVWCRCAHTFFKTLGVADSGQKLCAIDCDFNHPHCDNITQPAIHEYRNGVLTSDDFVKATEQEEKDFQKQLNLFNSTVMEVKTNIASLTLDLNEYNNTILETRSELENIVVTGLESINETLIGNTNNLHNVMAYSGLGCSFTQEPLLLTPKNVVSVGCGGLIEIPGGDLPTPKVFFMDYKSNQSYGAQERCLWTLQDTLPNGKKYHLKLRISVLCDGFGDPRDSVSIVTYDSGNNERLPTFGLQRHVQDFNLNSFSYYGTHINFTSNGYVAGTGFILRFEILGKNEVGTGVNYAFTTGVPVSQSFGPYAQTHRISIIINPQNLTRTTLTVDYLDAYSYSSCNNHDTLFVYEIGKRTPTNRLIRLCAKHTSPKQYTTEYPILILFWTNASTSGKGFKLSWS